eukprot:CAMPEP_0118936964 /NCGR_PEP_ID=MMETSP1169-20130426/21223_1 /TAXON_ID=36882 /ORGANISM="Pyramimonas obovata, Strain CCMP722" /LENGTH=478 /DNA_ID=CAMNT_0006880441 /DNA_START=285 /DNA_END=1721 /DNA_ORIENTATION=-
MLAGDNGPFATYDPSDSVTPFTGAVPSLIDAIFMELGASFEFVPISGTDNQTAQGRLEAMEAGDYDVSVHFSITEKEVKPIHMGGYGLGHEFIHTLPFYQSEIAGLTYRTKAGHGLWRFTEPFTAGMWASVGLTVIGFALSLVLVEHFQRCSKNDLIGFSHANLHLSSWSVYGRALAQSVLELLQGDSAEFQGDSAGEISALVLFPLRAGSLLLALVVLASYTANLAAFFTRPSWTVHGPSSMDELMTATVCTTLYTEYTMYSEELQQNLTSGPSPLRPLVGDIFLGDASLSADDCAVGWNTCQQEFCAEALRTGRADIWVDEKNALHRYQVFGRCDNFTKATFLGEMPLLTTAYLFALPSNGPLITNISAAIAFLIAQPAYSRVVDSALGIRQTCPSDGSGTDAVAASSMIGLFLVVASLMLTAILVSFVQAYVRKPARAAQKQLQRKASKSHSDREPTDRSVEAPELATNVCHAEL